MSTSPATRLLITNQILNSLSLSDYPSLFAGLRPVNLRQGKVLYELGERIDYSFFVTSGMISLLAITENGSTTELGMVGNEGVVGFSAILGVAEAPYRMKVQIAAKCMRIRTAVLVAEFDRSGPLREVMLRYVHSLMLQLSQSAVCNCFHTIRPRLCRVLLIARDRLHSDTLHLTQEALAQLLGSNRTNVTAAAFRLKSTGIIEYRRGCIQILDRGKLEKAACECYRAVSGGHLGYFRAA